MEDPTYMWEEARRNTIKKLISLGENLNKHARNTKIASVVGNGTSVAFGGTAVVLFLLVPFTAGISVIPAWICSGVAAAGTVTSVGSAVTNHFIEKDFLKDVQKALDKDRESFKLLLFYIEKAKDSMEIEKGIRYENTARKAIPRVATVGLKVGTKVAQEFAVTGATAAKLARLAQSAKFVGYAATFLALPVDIILFVKDVVDLARGNVSAAAESIFALAKQLQEEYDEVVALGGN